MLVQALGSFETSAWPNILSNMLGGLIKGLRQSKAPSPLMCRLEVKKYIYI